MNKRKQVITNILWLMWEKIFQLSISFFLSAWVARYLGPTQLGIINNVVAYIALLSPIATLALDNIAVEKIIDDESKKDQILGTSWVLKSIGSLAFIFCSVVIVYIFYPHDANMTWYMFIVSFGFLFRTVETVDFWFQANVKAQYSVITRNVVFLISSLIRIALVLLGAPLIWLIAVILIESIVSGIGMFIAYKVSKQKFHLWKFDRTLAVEMLKLSWPLILSGLAIGVFLKIDQIFIARLLGPSDLGIYSVAVKFTEIWNFVPAAIVMSLFPYIIRARKESLNQSRKLLVVLYIVLIAFGVVVSIFFTLFSDFIVNFFYGAQYLPASIVLRVYIWTLIFSAIGVVNGRYLIMIKKTKLSLYVTLVGAFIAVILSYLLIREYNIIGGAWASLISYGVVSILPIIYILCYNLFHWKKHHISS